MLLRAKEKEEEKTFAELDQAFLSLKQSKKNVEV